MTDMPKPSLLRRFLRARRGATAVEFSLLAAPFFALVFGIIEVSLTHLTNSTLQAAAQRVARYVATGENRCMTQAQIEAKICAEMNESLSQCRPVTSFMIQPLATANLNAPPIFGSAANVYSSGEPSDRMVIRLSRNQKSYLPFLDRLLARAQPATQGYIVLNAAYIFKNEPYTSTTCP